MMINQTRVGLIFSLLSGISWGTFGVFCTLCLSVGVTDYSLVALTPAALIVYFFARVMTKPQVLKGIPKVLIIGIMIQGGFLNNFMNFCYTQAFNANMPVAVTSTVAFCNVYVIMVVSRFVFDYKITMPKLLSATFALSGVCLVLGLFTSSDGQITFTGAIWTILIAITLGLNMVCDKYFLNKGVDPDAFMFILCIGSLSIMWGFLVNPVDMFVNIAEAASGSSIALVYILGFCAIPGILCYALMLEGIKRIEPSLFGICYSMDPVTATVLGFIVFAQAIALNQIVGIFIIIGAVCYLNWTEGKEEAATKV